MSARTFLALDVDEPCRKHLASVCERLGQTDAKVRWVRPRNLHVTLRFLGDVPDSGTADVCAIVAKVAGGIEPFDFDVRRIICVPPAGKLRMFWAGVEDPSGRMARLYDKLNAELACLELHVEHRSFQPHITVGRVKFVGNARSLRCQAEAFADESFGVQHAEEVVIYTSRLTPSGPVYTSIARAELRC